MKLSGNLRTDFDKVTEENVKLKDRILGYQERIKALQDSLKSSESAREKQKNSYESTIAQKDAIIKELSNKLAHMAAVAAHDGTNTGTPTASTPINKKKHIPNSRRGSNRSKGGQPGHKRHTMESFEASEITETVPHELKLAEDTCGLCGGGLLDTGRVVSKDEFDVEVHVVKRRHEYHIYQCADCGATVRQPIDRKLKEQNQYGSHVQALALSLMATGNVAVNKVRMLIHGMTGGLMNPSQGYICKLYKRACYGLDIFIRDLRKLLITRPLVYWDDTVIMILKKRACMRFYGDETISYFTAHEHKDMNSLLEDDILTVLTSETTVMHDHNRVNYNERFCFKNIECNQHLERDLQKITDDNPGHTWAASLKEHISKTIKERKDLIADGIQKFDSDYVKKFKAKVKRLLKKGKKENLNSANTYHAPFEKTVLTRIQEYMDNYFRWVEDFSLPTTDNLSERGLRGIKSHMKISGQFESEQTAKYYAVVKTYVETCRKNKINEMDALSRLCAGNPYTVAEIFS